MIPRPPPRLRMPLIIVDTITWFSSFNGGTSKPTEPVRMVVNFHSYRLYLVIPSPELEQLEAKKDKGFFTLSDSRRKQRGSNRRPVMQDSDFMKRVADIFENIEHAGNGDTINTNLAC